jgi:hypothetical protein
MRGCVFNVSSGRCAASSVVRQKFHDIRSRRSIGGALGIGPRLGSQPLVLVVAIAMALIRSGSDRGTDGTTVGGVGVDADWRAHSTALHTQANCGQQLLCWGGPLTQQASGFAYAGLSAGSDSGERCRSIFSSARDALVKPPQALSAYQARFTFSRMSRALAVQIYGWGLRLCWAM